MYSGVPATTPLTVRREASVASRDFGQTEVEEHGALALGGAREEHVGGFEIAVQEPGVVGGGEGLAELASEDQSVAPGQRAHAL